MWCGLLPGWRRWPYLQKAPWRHVTLCLSGEVPLLVAGKSAVHTLLNHNVFPPFDVRLRCPDNSRTLQRGSFSFTDCGCIVGYINVANVTAGLTARRPTLEVGGCFHERNLFGPANELSDRIGILFFRKVSHESFTHFSVIHCYKWGLLHFLEASCTSHTSLHARCKLFCERRSISLLPREGIAMPSMGAW